MLGLRLAQEEQFDCGESLRVKVKRGLQARAQRGRRARAPLGSAATGACGRDNSAHDFRTTSRWTP